MKLIRSKHFFEFILIFSIFISLTNGESPFQFGNKMINKGKLIKEILNISVSLESAIEESRFTDAAVFQKKIVNLTSLIENTKINMTGLEMSEYAFNSLKSDYESTYELEKENVEISKNVILEIICQLASKGHRLIAFQSGTYVYPNHPMFNNDLNRALFSYFKYFDDSGFVQNEWYSVLSVLTDDSYFPSPTPYYTFHIGKGNYGLTSQILHNSILYAKDIKVKTKTDLTMKVISNKEKLLTDYFEFISLIQILFDPQEIDILRYIMSDRVTLTYLKLALHNSGYKIGSSNEFPLIISLYDEKQLNLTEDCDFNAINVNYESNIDIETAFGKITWFGEIFSKRDHFLYRVQRMVLNYWIKVKIILMEIVS